MLSHDVSETVVHIFADVLCTTQDATFVRLDVLVDVSYTRRLKAAIGSLVCSVDDVISVSSVMAIGGIAEDTPCNAIDVTELVNKDNALDRSLHNGIRGDGVRVRNGQELESGRVCRRIFVRAS